MTLADEVIDGMADACEKDRDWVIQRLALAYLIRSQLDEEIWGLIESPLIPFSVCDEVDEEKIIKQMGQRYERVERTRARMTELRMSIAKGSVHENHP